MGRSLSNEKTLILKVFDYLLIFCILVYSYPPHDLDVPEFSIDWLYPTLAQYYSRFFKSEDQQTKFIEDFSFRGHYSIVIKPGLRLIMVNPNGCLAHNL